MSDRIVSAEISETERIADAALRPTSLNEFVGQSRVRDQLDLLIQVAQQFSMRGT